MVEGNRYFQRLVCPRRGEGMSLHSKQAPYKPSVVTFILINRQKSMCQIKLAIVFICATMPKSSQKISSSSKSLWLPYG
jgi:hypothetical protein